jgi:putative flippase GtrA
MTERLRERRAYEMTPQRHMAETGGGMPPTGRPGLLRALAKGWRLEPVRFVLVGLLNTAFGYTVYAVLVLLGLHYTAAVTLASILGVLFNFRSTGGIVFRNTQWQRIGRFVLVYAVALGLNIGLLWLVQKAGPGAIVSQAICLPFVVAVTYALQRYFVFVKGEPRRA